jgi:D-xylose transport system substrate-binding protein
MTRQRPVDGQPIRTVCGRGVRRACVLGIGLALVFTAGCTGTGTPKVAASPTGAAASTTAAGACRKVGVLLPDTADPRWEQQDRPQLAKLIPAAAPGVQIGFDNAAGNASTQQAQGAADLANGDCVLLVAPVDPVVAARIVSAAAAKKVPVIAYVKPVQSRHTAYFVGFNAVQIGQLQGQYIADHYASYDATGRRNVAVINGDQTDPLALLQHQGQATPLQPLFDNATLRKIYDQFTPAADPATAATEMEGVLVANQNNVQVAAVANDEMATSVVGVLVQRKLAGQVLVTGSGATLPALHNILLGNQAMTVETNPEATAQAAAHLIGAIVHGATTTGMVNGHLSTSDGGSVPAMLQTPVAVDKTNIAATVIADGSVSKAQLCTGIPAGTAALC